MTVTKISGRLPQQQRGLFETRQMLRQQQHEGEPAEVKYGETVLSPDNAKVFSARGFDKGGKNGGPVDVNAFLDTIRNQDGLIGKNNLAPPDMTVEDPFKAWDGGRKALGILDKPEEYKFNRREMPKGADGKQIAYDEEGEKVLRDAIAGVVPQKYAQRVYDKLVDLQVARSSAFQQQLVEDKTKTDAWLTQNWAGQKDTKIARATVIADRIAEKLGMTAAELKNEAQAMKGSVGMLRMFDFLADQFGEGFIKDGGGGGDPGNENTPAGAKAALEKLDADKDFQTALKDAYHTNHKAAVQRRAKLFQIAKSGK